MEVFEETIDIREIDKNSKSKHNTPFNHSNEKDKEFYMSQSNSGTNSTEDVTSIDSQSAIPVDKLLPMDHDRSARSSIDSQGNIPTFAVVTTEKLNLEAKNTFRPLSMNSYSGSPATTEQSLSSSSSSSSLYNIKSNISVNSNNDIPSPKNLLSETEKLQRIIDQLKMEKQCLVDSVIKLSAQSDEDQRIHKNEKTQLTTELSVYKNFYVEYEKNRRKLDSDIVEILRSEISDEGLPIVHEELIEKCQSVILESMPMHVQIPKIGSGENGLYDCPDIFIDHYNVSVMIEANLADDTAEKDLKTSLGMPSDTDLTDKSMSPMTSFQKSTGGSYGEITTAKIAKLPEKYIMERKRSSGNTLGREKKSDSGFSNENNSSRSRLSLSVKSYGSHISMDSLRRRSMMETRIKCDDEPYDSDNASVISSISEQGNDSSFKSTLRDKKAHRKARKLCICGAYGPRKERSKPSSYRYYDEEGNLVITNDGSLSPTKEINAQCIVVEGEFDSMQLNEREGEEEDEEEEDDEEEEEEQINSSSEQNIDKKGSFNWRWW